MELDKQALKRLEDISQLPEENRKFILNLLDMALRNFKVKKHTTNKPVRIAQALFYLQFSRRFLVYIGPQKSQETTANELTKTIIILSL